MLVVKQSTIAKFYDTINFGAKKFWKSAKIYIEKFYRIKTIMNGNG